MDLQQGISVAKDLHLIPDLPEVVVKRDQQGRVIFVMVK
jgi:hypothetical protein